ncbi:SIMPL domain-containing protein [Rhodothermus marinus]|uniref:SIMPL domain-containing protein n=1 Tax=Rhodothermus marinus TaxID=29549 RepID=UPI0012BA4EFA|nr:SIMPL domain-containing protein [Rhodothermus marinus]BBM69774.1 SIMPL domain-containing protein [Rhodothermus marinus]BBM72760.1 SIMPL domain-containing protein [Rhodothermus marinus]
MRLLLVGLVMAWTGCLAARAQVIRMGTETPAVPTITVQGEGVVRVQPDRATLRFAVVTRDLDPEQARRRNAEASRRALNAVRALGVEERWLHLEALTLHPVREYNPDLRRWEEKGYEVQRVLRVELDDLDRLPEVVARVVQQGANRLQGIQYDVSNQEAVRLAALQAAVRNAREKARQMLAELNREVGDPIRITEQALEFPRPLWRADMAALRTAEAAPEPEAYAAGEIEVQARVEITFAIR